MMLLPQGYVPMFVNATGGSTVYGAFDPINEIADICEKYNMWLHVDVRKHPSLDTDTIKHCRAAGCRCNPGSRKYVTLSRHVI